MELSYYERRFYFVVKRRVVRHFIENDDEPLTITQRKDSKAAVNKIKKALLSKHLAHENTPQHVVGKPTVLTNSSKINVY